MNRSRMGCGLWLILLGLIFLLINVGIWDWSIWWSFFEFWPILIILLGLHFLFRRSFLWFIPIVATLLFVVFVGSFGSDFRFSDWVRGETVEEDFSFNVGPNISRVDIEVNVDAVRMQMSAGDDLVVSGNLVSSSGLDPTAHYRERGSVADVILETNRHRFWNWIFRNAASSWDLALPTGIPTSITVNGGAGDFQLDMRGVDVRNVIVRGGVGNFVLLFDEVGWHTQASVTAALSNVEIVVPEGVGLRIRVDGVGASTNFADAGLVRTAGWWQTPDYEASERTIEVDATTAFGKVRVVRGK